MRKFFRKVIKELLKLQMRVISRRPEDRSISFSRDDVGQAIHKTLCLRDLHAVATIEREVEDFVRNRLPRDVVIALPRLGGSLGDTISIVHYARLYAQRHSLRVIYVAPRVKPHIEYAEFLFQKEDRFLLSGRWWEGAVESVVQPYTSISREGIKKLMPLTSFVLNLIRKCCEKEKLLEVHDVERMNPFEGVPEIREEKNRILRDSHRAYLSLNTFSEAHCRYLDWLNEQWENPWESYHGFSHDHLSGLKKKLKIDRPYVCLHIKMERYFPEIETYYIQHPEVYAEGIEYLIGQGYQVVTLGMMEEPGYQEMIRKSFGDRMVEYHHTPLQNLTNDLHLVAGCEFMIGCCSGPATLCDLFHKPMLRLNVSFLASAEVKGWQRFYPLGLRDRATGLALGWREIFETDLVFSHRRSHLKNHGYDVEEMSSGEILEAIREILTLIREKSWRELSEAQREYRDYLRPVHLYLNNGLSLPCDCFLNRETK